MAELITVIIIALVGGATIVALLVTTSLLLPKVSTQTATTLATMPGRSFILGAVNFLFFFAVAAVLAQIGEQLPGGLGGLFGLMALSLALLILSVMTLGLTGLIVLLSERLGRTEPVAVSRKLGAAVLLVGAGMAPVVGWFILTPLALLAGIGAAIIALVQWISKRNPQPVDPD